MPERKSFDPRKRHLSWPENVAIENNPLARRARTGPRDLPVGYTSRTFACEACGQLRRREWKGPSNKPIAFEGEQYPYPRCDGVRMRLLGKAQANAVGKLSRGQIVVWLRHGGRVRVDRKRWIALL